MKSWSSSQVRSQCRSCSGAGKPPCMLWRLSAQVRRTIAPADLRRPTLSQVEGERGAAQHTRRTHLLLLNPALLQQRGTV